MSDRAPHDGVPDNSAPYDAVADWYETAFLVAQRSMGRDGFADSLGIDQGLVELLGEGSGPCLEVGCGTGIYAERVRQLGWSPVGVDLSMGMLRYGVGREPAALGDARHLPLPDGAVPAATAVMVHTDMPDYPAVLRETYRVLRPGGIFVHIGVHPCFCGGFANRSNPAAVVIEPGYLDGRWTTDSWTNQGLRDKVGATHWPIADLLAMTTEAGFELEAFREGGAPAPITFSFRAAKS